VFVQCPLPYSQSTAARGSLGAKKSYSGGVDLLAAIQRRVGLADVQQKPADFSSTVSELVLYDPEEHRLFLAEQEAAAQQDNTPPESSSADPSPQLEPPATQAAGQLPPTAPSAPTTAASTANIALEKHVKVHADPFLVAKLRPHQREGVK
jgi:hypothetical protein